MFSEHSTVLSSNQEAKFEDPIAPKRPLKKIILIIALVLAVAAFVVSIFLIINKIKQNEEIPAPLVEQNNETGFNEKPVNTLPDLNGESENEIGSGKNVLPYLNVEYLSFSDFYKAPDNNLITNFKDYELPINIKIDGLNYYDLARKINLDAAVNDLNRLGFAVLDNPWSREINDFYSIYERLEQKQVPIMITSDFLIYYYQNSLKKIFKDIEEDVFYTNLWLVTKELYTLAKNRYEARLASIGQINDSILEGQRMAMVFFAVALELLKAESSQIVSKGSLEEVGKFSQIDADRFSFNPAPYIRADVLAEVTLIKTAKDIKKSPNLLYIRDYSEFKVPNEYKNDAKLNNFYLASKWLNSVFPLEYKSATCLDCLLDKEDWRLSMIAASLISTDFSSRPDLKNRWARVYKLMGYFSGLREEINYVDYRDALTYLFGENYVVEEIFDDYNKEAFNNLEKLRNKLLTYEYPIIRGALDKNDPANKAKIGFKMLAEPYWPNDYIFSRLTWPQVGKYTGEDKRPNNLTACDVGRGVIVRCNGISLDIANLVRPLTSHEIFDENSQYENYIEESIKLTAELNSDALWHTSNYWSTISIMRALTSKQVRQPVFTNSLEWENKNINTAISAWVNMQLPLEAVSLAPVFRGQGLTSFARYSEYAYIEPNLPLINELIAINNMIAQMFAALRLNEEISSATRNIQLIDNDLQALRKIIIKELSGEELDEKDGEIITDFARRYLVDANNDSDKIVEINFPKNKIILQQNLSQLKLMAVVHLVGNNKVISVGPVWSNQESRQ